RPVGHRRGRSGPPSAAPEGDPPARCAARFANQESYFAPHKNSRACGHVVICRWTFSSLPPLSPREAVERGGQGPKGGRQDVGHFSAGHGWPVRKTPQRGTHSPGAARRAPDGGALLFGSFLLGTQEK